MWNRNSIGITVVIVILIIDLLIYKYQNANCVNKILLRCYPTGEIYPYKDAAGRIKYDSVSIPFPTSDSTPLNRVKK